MQIMKTIHHHKSIGGKLATASIILVLPLTLFSCANYKLGTPPSTNAKRLTSKVAADNATYAMMAENAYHRKHHSRYAVEQLGWKQITADGTPANTGKPSYANLMGLAVDIYRNDKEDRYAYVFRGTDSKQDWLIANLAAGPSMPYKSARKQFGAFLCEQLKGNRKQVVAVGHSLGGGLAGSQSLRYGVDAVMFNTSPRMFDGWGDIWHEKEHPDEPKPGRLTVEQRGEVLAAARAASTKYPNVMKGHPEYFCEGHPQKHQMTLLLEDILEKAVKHDPKYKPFLDQARRNSLVK